MIFLLKNPLSLLTKLLDKEPTLLEEFVPYFLELELDKVAEVRKTLVAFLDEVIKQFPLCACSDLSVVTFLSLMRLLCYSPCASHAYLPASMR